MSILKPGGGGVRNSLSRPVDADYGEDWARELARPAAGTGSTDASAMVFRIGAEWLAVPLALAASVAPVAPVHRLPHRGGGGPLLGIVAAGGKLLPAVSLARLLEIDAGAAVPAGRHAFARLLVVAESDPQRGSQRSPGTFALPVDEVQGVVRYAVAGLLPPAATVGRAPPPLVSGVLPDAVRGVVGSGFAGSSLSAGGLAAGAMADGAAAGLLDARLLMTALKGLLR